MTRLSTVLSPADLPLPELYAARLDGELFGIDECFCPVDQAPGMEHRGAALAAVSPDRLIAEQHSAAWIWGALDHPPAPHQFCASIGARVRPALSKRLLVREVVIDDESIVSIGGMLVTTVLRTIIDLARFSEPFGRSEISIVRRLVDIGDLDFAACIDGVHSRRNLPNKHRALERIALAAVDSIHVVDRVDAPHGVEHPIEVGGVAHLEHEAAQGKAIA